MISNISIKVSVLMFISTLLLLPGFVSAKQPEIVWQSWSEDLFEKAQKENKFVILDLEAVWCHWCHVMEDVTYQNPMVIELINKKYIAVRVDQEADPALASRYEDYGWPATIVFAPDGSEIVTRSGYIDPIIMTSLLQAIIDDPSPGPSVFPKTIIKPSENAFLSTNQKKKIQNLFNEVYDKQYGGWSRLHKYIDADSMEYAISQASKGDKNLELQSRTTLDSGLNLFDPVWGGVYQYSDQSDWKSPHYEKIMSFQRDNLKIYSLAYAKWKDEKYLKAAQSIYSYLTEFLLSPQGGFYTSQDADLSKEMDGHEFYALNNSQRRKSGLPRIDKNIYARENGWAIQGLLALYNVTNDSDILDRAILTAEYILENYSVKKNSLTVGFSHRKQDTSGPYLGNNVSMATAMLDLYAATGDRRWLEKTERTVRFINSYFFDNQGGGFISAIEKGNKTGVFAKPVKKYEENLASVRLLNNLFHYTGKSAYQSAAKSGMQYLASPDMTMTRRFLIGLLLADADLASDPVHITVVGSKDDRKSLQLHQAARLYPASYKRLEWWDRREGPLPNSDVQYPKLKNPAVFACSDSRCSLPITDANQLAKIVAALNK